MKKKVRRILALVLAAAVVGALAFLPRLAGRGAAGEGSVLSTAAATVTIPSELSGGGTLGLCAGEDGTVPQGAVILRYLVSEGEVCAPGQALAELDPSSLLSVVYGIQTSLESIEKDIKALPATTNSSVSAPLSGRVKAVYAQKGDSAERICADKGALLVLSLDGLMKVSFSSSIALPPGDAVVVRTPDGASYPGKIKSVSQNRLLALLTDDGPALGDTAELFTPDGTPLGVGVLEVNSPWRLVASDGQVSAVAVRAEQKVSRGTRLMSFTDSAGAERAHLTQQHREYEELLRQVLAMLRTGTLNAPRGGIVSSLDTSLLQPLSAVEPGRVRFLSDEETESFSYTLVMLLGPAQDGLYPARTAPWPFPVEDESQFALLSAMAPALLEEAEIGAVAISDATEPDGSPAPEGTAGDLFVLVRRADGTLEKTVHIGRSEPSTEPTGPVLPDITLPDIDLSALLGGGYDPGTAQTQSKLFPLEGRRACVLSDADTLELRIAVDEREVLSYAPGMTARVTLDAIEDESFEAVVEQVSATGASNGGSSKFDVLLRLARDERMLPGMSAYATVRTGESTVCLGVPVSAVFDRGSKSFVYTAYDAKNDKLLAPVPVEIGPSDGQNVAILSGLTEGQSVWYRG